MVTDWVLVTVQGSREHWLVQVMVQGTVPAMAPLMGLVTVRQNGGLKGVQLVHLLETRTE